MSVEQIQTAVQSDQAVFTAEEPQNDREQNQKAVEILETAFLGIERPQTPEGGLLKTWNLKPETWNMKATEHNQLLTRKELSAYLKVSPSTIWRYVKENRIQMYSISGRRYFKKSEIDNNLIQLRIKN